MSIKNQKEMFTQYVREQGWTLYDYYNLEEFDRPTLVRLIQKIEVDEKRMVDGHEERDFNIYYNFIGHIDL